MLFFSEPPAWLTEHEHLRIMARVRATLLALAVCIVAASGRAEDSVTPIPSPKREAPPTLTDIRDVGSFAWFFSGALTGLFAHEMGHVTANLAYGNVPKLVGLRYFGVIPFFAISPRIECRGNTCYDHDGDRFRGGRRGKFVITSAGFNVQHFTDELLLQIEPGLRFERSPFRKGLFAFNTLLSIGYAIAAWTGTEDPHGDVTRSAGLAGLPPEIYAGVLIVPALFDLYRYYTPDSRWAPWLSCGSKTVFFSLIFAAPR